MTITALPTAPSRTQDPDTFDANVDAFVSALPTFVSEANALAQAMNLNSTTDASLSSVLIGTGAKTFTVSADKSFVGGMYVVIADSTAPSTNLMVGSVTSYSGTTLIVNVEYVRGSGTLSSWIISQSAPAANIAEQINGATDKTTPVGADEVGIRDSVSGLLNRVSFTNMLTWFAAKLGNSSNVFSVAAATDAAHAVRADQIQGQSVTAFTTAGTSTAYTLTPTPAITAYTSGQRFNVTFDSASGTAPTITISGVATPPNLVKQNVDGTYSNLAANDFPSGWKSDVILVSASQALVANLPKRISQGTATATTSGTSVDYSSIPSGARRITVSFSGFSTNGTSHYLVQIGDSGGIEATGYLGASDANGTLSNFSTGFMIVAGGANVVIHGSMTLSLLDSATNTWAAEYSVGRSDSAVVITGGGSKALSAELTTVRITTVNGTDVFDAGLVNVQWEF